MNSVLSFLMFFSAAFVCGSLSFTIARWSIRRRVSRQWQQHISTTEWLQRMRRQNLGRKLPKQ